MNEKNDGERPAEEKARFSSSPDRIRDAHQADLLKGDNLIPPVTLFAGKWQEHPTNGVIDTFEKLKQQVKDSKPVEYEPWQLELMRDASTVAAGFMTPGEALKRHRERMTTPTPGEGLPGETPPAFADAPAIAGPTGGHDGYGGHKLGTFEPSPQQAAEDGAARAAARALAKVGPNELHATLYVLAVTHLRALCSIMGNIDPYGKPEHEQAVKFLRQLAGEPHDPGYLYSVPKVTDIIFGPGVVNHPGKIVIDDPHVPKEAPNALLIQQAADLADRLRRGEPVILPTGFDLMTPREMRGRFRGTDGERFNLSANPPPLKTAPKVDRFGPHDSFTLVPVGEGAFVELAAGETAYVYQAGAEWFVGVLTNPTGDSVHGHVSGGPDEPMTLLYDAVYMMGPATLVKWKGFNEDCSLGVRARFRTVGAVVGIVKPKPEAAKS